MHANIISSELVIRLINTSCAKAGPFEYPLFDTMQRTDETWSWLQLAKIQKRWLVMAFEEMGHLKRWNGQREKRERVMDGEDMGWGV